MCQNLMMGHHMYLIQPLVVLLVSCLLCSLPMFFVIVRTTVGVIVINTTHVFSLEIPLGRGTSTGSTGHLQGASVIPFSNIIITSIPPSLVQVFLARSTSATSMSSPARCHHSLANVVPKLIPTICILVVY